MRRSLLLALVLFLTLTVPAYAQLFPPGGADQPPASPSERVLIDVELWVNPPDAPGMCMMLGAGNLTIAARVTKDAIEQRPTLLTLRGLMEDPQTNISINVGLVETVSTTRISGGRYCWNVAIQAPETGGMSNVQRGAYIQEISLRITHTGTP